MAERFRTIALFALIVALPIFAASCSCGVGDNGGGDDKDDGPAFAVEFTPDEAGGDGEIRLTFGEAKSNTFTLRLVGDAVSLYGLGARLAFETDIIELTAVTPDAALGADGESIAHGVATKPGAVLGASRAGRVPNVMLEVGEPAATLTFRIKVAGSTDISFDEEQSSALDENLEPVAISAWRGGHVTIVPAS
ncbi:hypothetical protein K8I61_07945 [bacterium]|nr:hypothetical protein [bacterium]